MVLEAVERARRGEGPSIVEVKTYRFREHGEGAVFRVLARRNYRDPVEHQKWLTERDPIMLYSKKLIEDGTLSEEEYEALRQSEEDRIAEAVQFAKDSPFPEPEEAYVGVYSNPIE